LTRVNGCGGAQWDGFASKGPIRPLEPSLMNLRKTLITLIAIGISASVSLAAGAGVASAADENAQTESKGRALVEANCVRCHATGPSSSSNHPDAPPFREVVTRYPAETLAEALAEGISTGHPDMPMFTFEPDEIEAIVAYLGSLGR